MIDIFTGPALKRGLIFVLFSFNQTISITACLLWSSVSIIYKSIQMNFFNKLFGNMTYHDNCQIIKVCEAKNHRLSHSVT